MPGNALASLGPVMQQGGNMLARGAQAFARGFDPESAKGFEQEAQARQKDQLGKTLAWLQQTKQIPEVEREAWTMQNADAIARDTGADPRKVGSGMSGGMGSNPYADAELDKAIAAISAGLGQGPVTEEAYTLAPGAKRMLGNRTLAENPRTETGDGGYTLAPGAVRYGSDGKMISENPRAANPESPPWPGAVKNAQGQWVYDENYLKGQTTLRSASKPQTNIYTGDLTKANETALQGKVLDATNVMARLKGIEAEYDPKFLTIQNQAANFVRGTMERAGVKLNPQEKDALKSFTTFQQNTMNNLNRTLQELSGAAVTPQEFERIKQELPAMRDGPTAFKTKMDNAIQLQRAAIARQQYFLQNQIPFNDQIAANYPLEQFIDDVAKQGAPDLGAGKGVSGPPLDADDQAAVEEMRNLGWPEERIRAAIGQ